MACRPFRPDACYPSHLTPSPRSFPRSTRFRLLLSVHQPLGRSVARSRSGFPLWLTAPSLTPRVNAQLAKKKARCSIQLQRALMICLPPNSWLPSYLSIAQLCGPSSCRAG